MNAIAGATRRAKLNEIRASFVIFIPCSVFLPKIYCILITRLSWHSSYTCTRSIHFSSLPNILIHPSRSWGTTRLPSRCTNPSFLLGPRSSTQRRAKFRIEKNRWWGTLFWQWASSWLIDLILSFSSNPTRLSFPTNLIPPTSGGLITQVRTANSNCAFLGQYSRYGYLVLCSSFWMKIKLRDRTVWNPSFSNSHTNQITPFCLFPLLHSILSMFHYKVSLLRSHESFLNPCVWFGFGFSLIQYIFERQPSPSTHDS